MEQSPSREANRFSVSQEIPRIIWNPKGYCHIHKGRHLSLFWARPIQSSPHPTSWRSILILSSNLLLGLPSGLFLSDFPIKHCMHLSFPPHVLIIRTELIKYKELKWISRFAKLHCVTENNI